MTKESRALINDFAVRSFRDTADLDYIAARLAYRAQCVPQFLWLALQAIEKYLKAILVFNRVPAKNLGHDLGAALKLVNEKAPFTLELTEASKEMIRHLDTYGRFRYLETPFHVRGWMLPQLDKTIWEIRRYCAVIDYEIQLANGVSKNMLELELDRIRRSAQEPPQDFKQFGGLLEKIVADRKHASREGLVWQNLFFGQRRRKRIRGRTYMMSTNSPLSLHPEILDEVLKYVFLPKDVIAAYRQEVDRRADEVQSQNRGPEQHGA